MKTCSPIRNGPINGPSAGTRRGWFSVRSVAAAEPVEILIYDQIGRDWFDGSGVEAKAFAEALAAIDRQRQIVVGINSPGGNVWDGLAIYHQLAMRRDRVTVRVDGLAASIASIIALAGHELFIPANALLMIHDPSGLVMGNSAEMRQMADRLDVHADVLAEIYAAKAGGNRKQWRDRMRAETWYTGAEAVEAGLADTVGQEIQLAAHFDLTSFRHVPAALQSQRSGSPAGNHHQPQDPMNKSKIIALLRRHGITVADNATNSQLTDLLAQLPDSAAEERAQAEAFLAGGSPQPAPTGAGQGTATVPAAVPTPAPVAGPTTVPAPVAAADPRITDLQRQLNTERERRIGTDLDGLIQDRPYLASQRADWLRRAMADEAVLASLRSMPVVQPGVEPLQARAQALGNPLLDTYAGMQPGAARQLFRIQHFERIQRANAEFRSPRAANTLAAALVTDWLADGLVVVANNKLSALRAFSRDFGTDPMKPRATVQVRKATTAGAAQTNPTNFEAGDSTLAAIPVTVNQVSRSFHLLNNELNSGHRLAHLARINANSFVNALSDVWTALLLVADWAGAAGLVIGAAANFDAEDLKPIMADGKNFDAKNLVLDGGHLAYLLPTDREKFRIGEAGAYGFDLITEQNRWTGATANTVGLLAAPDAMAVASGLPLALPNGEFLENAQITISELGLVVNTCTWFSRAGRVTWASYDVMFGAAVGDSTQGKMLITA